MTRTDRMVLRLTEARMDRPELTLAQLGWGAVFSEQVSVDEAAYCRPVRVISVHRGRVTVASDDFNGSILSGSLGHDSVDNRPTVGDWLLIDRHTRRMVRILGRTSLFKRPSPGDDRRVQLIAANVDTLFVVSSCNQDFNVARLERYLVLSQEAGVRPVVVLTKADLTVAPERFVAEARALQAGLHVELVDGRDPECAARLLSYCGRGETIALVGSSGVGKSTLINTLTGSDAVATQTVREDDGKGRHTTTVREMHRLAGAEGGGWLVDTPGIRELGMSEVASGVTDVFDDITATALECRFANCAHAEEPGCAIRIAMTEGELDTARVERWRKLAEENAANSGVAASRRSRPGRAGSRR